VLTAVRCREGVLHSVQPLPIAPTRGNSAFRCVAWLGVVLPNTCRALERPCPGQMFDALSRPRPSNWPRQPPAQGPSVWPMSLL
jgi:hypothetical protein